MLAGFAMVALLVGGQALTPEQPVAPPSTWPSGQRATFVATPFGTFVALFDGDDRPVTLVLPADGSAPAPVRHPTLRITSPMQLALTAQGVLATFAAPATDQFYRQRFDARTGAALEPARLSLATELPQRLLTGASPRLLAAGWRGLADGGTQTWVVRLNDDGTPAAAPVDLTTTVRSIDLFASTAHRHWALSSTGAPDGGVNTLVVTLSDEGSVVATRAVDDVARSVVARQDALAIITTPLVGAGLRVTFLDEDLNEVARARLDQTCSPSSGSAFADGVVFGCNGSQAPFSNTSLHVIRAVLDGGLTDSLSWGGDGGAVRVDHVSAGAQPMLVFQRQFKELGSGSWEATYALPVSASGLAATGPGLPLLLRQNAQTAPSFMTKRAGLPNALLWNDDEQLPEETLIKGVRLDGAGAPAPPATSLELPTSVFTRSNLLGRIGATDGTSTIVVLYNAARVAPLEWPLDAGAPVARPEVVGGVGAFGQPMVAARSTALNAGYAVTWSLGASGAVVRPLDSRGVATGGAVPATPGEVLDVLAVEDGQVLLVAENGVLGLKRLNAQGTSVTPWVTVNVADAGYVCGRLARSNQTLLAAWQTVQPFLATTTVVAAARIALDGGEVEGRVEAAVRRTRFARSLGDVGVRSGAFTLTGTAELDDGGTALWFWRVADAVGEPQPVVFDEVMGVDQPVFGPQVDDGGLLVAYSRDVAGPNGTTPQVFIRALEDPRPPGGACERGADCASGLCVAGRCCAGEGACQPPGLAVASRLGCGCAVGGGAAVWWAALGVAVRLVRRVARLSSSRRREAARVPSRGGHSGGRGGPSP